MTSSPHSGRIGVAAGAPRLSKVQQNVHLAQQLGPALVAGGSQVQNKRVCPNALCACQYTVLCDYPNNSSKNGSRIKARTKWLIGARCCMRRHFLSTYKKRALQVFPQSPVYRSSYSDPPPDRPGWRHSKNGRWVPLLDIT